jgi:Phosphotransferase enzyme family
MTTMRPWEQAEWQETITNWIAAAWGIKAELLQFESTNSSDLRYVARILFIGAKGNKKVFYFKAGDRTREAKVTAYLARTRPDLVPEVMAYDAERDWLLSKDGGQHLSNVAELHVWQKCLAKLADFQRNADTEGLRGLGCPFYSFETLAERGEVFLRNVSYLQSWGMTDEQRRGLELLLPHLHEAHTRIISLGLKESAAHGDAQPMNALVNNMTCLWFDWCEASIAHPFTDVGWLLAWTFVPIRELPLFQQHAAASQLWSGYLEALGLESSNASMSDAMLMSLVQRILVYHERFYSWEGTVPNWRPQYVTYFLKLLLKLGNKELL